LGSLFLNQFIASSMAFFFAGVNVPFGIGVPAKFVRAVRVGSLTSSASSSLLRSSSLNPQRSGLLLRRQTAGHG
jgi:hypothetical protein